MKTRFNVGNEQRRSFRIAVSKNEKILLLDPFHARSTRVSAFPFRGIQRRERIVARRVVLEQKKEKGRGTVA